MHSDSFSRKRCASIQNKHKWHQKDLRNLIISLLSFRNNHVLTVSDLGPKAVIRSCLQSSSNTRNKSERPKPCSRLKKQSFEYGLVFLKKNEESHIAENINMKELFDSTLSLTENIRNGALCQERKNSKK